MPVPLLTPLPGGPSTSDPANFDVEADALIAAVTTLITEVNASVTAFNALVAGATNVGNATTLLNKTWAIPDPIGATTPNEGVFTKVRSAGQSLPGVLTNTATSLLTLVNGTAYLVQAYSSNDDFHAWAMVARVGGAAKLLTTDSDSVNFTLSVSGNDVRVTQVSGFTRTVDWTALQLAI